MFTLHFIVIAVIAALVYSYHPYYAPLFTYYTSRSKEKNLDKIEAMKVLIESPGIGHFFYEELVSKLAYSEEWEEVMKYSSGAILSPVN